MKTFIKNTWLFAIGLILLAASIYGIEFTNAVFDFTDPRWHYRICFASLFVSGLIIMGSFLLVAYRKRKEYKNYYLAAEDKCTSWERIYEEMIQVRNSLRADKQSVVNQLEDQREKTNSLSRQITSYKANLGKLQNKIKIQRSNIEAYQLAVPLPLWMIRALMFDPNKGTQAKKALKEIYSTKS